MKQIVRYCLLMLPVAAGAQTVEPPPGHGFVRVFTPERGTILMAGDSTLGPATAIHALPLGTHQLRLVDGEAGAWNPRVDSVEIEVVAGAFPQTVALSLPVRYRITTMPSGANVVLEGAGGTREPLGVTPLVVDRRTAMTGMLVASRAGYAEARAAPGDSAVNDISMVLAPLTEQQGAAVDWRPPRRARTWIDVAAGGLALAGAAVAIHYKFRADAVDDRYRSPDSPERGDPALRVEAQRLDRISAGALGVMQLGLGVLAIRLVLR